MAKKKNNGLNNCAWCFRPTSLPAVFAPSTPLIEWIEEKINIVANHKQIKRSDIWGEHSDWGKLGLGQKFEIELTFKWNGRGCFRIYSSIYKYI